MKKRKHEEIYFHIKKKTLKYIAYNILVLPLVWYAVIGLFAAIIHLDKAPFAWYTLGAVFGLIGIIVLAAAMTTGQEAILEWGENK